jgi:hypothetical protein
VGDGLSSDPARRSRIGFSDHRDRPATSRLREADGFRGSCPATL